MGGSSSKEAGTEFGGVVPGSEAPHSLARDDGVDVVKKADIKLPAKAPPVEIPPNPGAAVADVPIQNATTITLPVNAPPETPRDPMPIDVPANTHRANAVMASPPGEPRIVLNNIAAAAGIMGETERKSLKLAAVEHELSEVTPFLFVSGVHVAGDAALLRAKKITHIVNCAGGDCTNHFPAEFEYVTLFLEDNKAERVDPFLPTIVNFMEQVRVGGGRVLVHCWQGVSRSVSFVVAYLMWKNRINFDAARDMVRAVRNVARPNLAFQCQLMEWRRLQQQSVADVAMDGQSRLYAVVNSTQLQGGGEVCRTVLRLCLKVGATVPCVPTADRLDSRGVFVLYTAATGNGEGNCKLYVWHGPKCPAQTVQDTLAGLGTLGPTVLSMEASGANAEVVYLGAKDHVIPSMALGTDDDHAAFWSILGCPQGKPAPTTNAQHLAEYDRFWSAGEEEKVVVEASVAGKEVVVDSTASSSPAQETGPVMLYKYIGPTDAFDGSAWEDLYGYEYEDLGEQDASEDLFLLASGGKDGPSFFFVGAKCVYPMLTPGTDRWGVPALIEKTVLKTKGSTSHPPHPKLTVILESDGLTDEFHEMFENGM